MHHHSRRIGTHPNFVAGASRLLDLYRNQIKRRIVSEVPYEERRIQDGSFRHFGYNCLN
jgi:hypothetical protein